MNSSRPRGIVFNLVAATVCLLSIAVLTDRVALGASSQVRSVAVQKPSPKPDPLQKELELNAADFDGLRRHMQGVKAFDESTIAKHDISSKRARAMSSEALILQIFKEGLYVIYMLYDNPTIGVYRVTLSAPSLIELCKRNDLGQAFAAAYKHMQLDPSRDPRFDRDGGCLRLISTDTLVQYPPIRRKLAGHEKEVILAMGEDLAEARRVDAAAAPGKEIFGNTGSTVQAAAKILAQANPSLKVDLIRFRSTDAAMKAILDRAKTLQ